MYHYLTGSVSWLLLTVLNEVFGVKGSLEDLILQPKLMAEQFDEAGTASVETVFANRRLEVVYKNAFKLDYKKYKIGMIRINNNEALIEVRQDKIIIPRTLIEALEQNETHKIQVELI